MDLRNSKPLSIGDGSGWRFINGDWMDGEDGGLATAEDMIYSDGDSLQGHHYAFYTRNSYGDVRMSFDIRLSPHSDTGIILRAKDESNFYILHFPNCGQAFRTQHFWVALSKMDETGYLKLVKLEMVRRVPSNGRIWLSARMNLVGNKISVDIGDHGHFEAEDESFPSSGCIGVYSHRPADIRNVVVDGEELPSIWNDKAHQPVNWFEPCPDTVYGLSQLPVDLLRLPSGKLVLNYCVFKDGQFAGHKTPLVVWSNDDGRTWSEPEVLKVVKEDNYYLPAHIWLTPGKRLMYMAQTKNGYVRAESKDEGRTWSEPVPVALEIPPKMKDLHHGPQTFLNLADGSMLWFLYGPYELSDPDLTVYNWGALHVRAYCLRSIDDGLTWSAPVNMDNSANLGQPEQSGNLDLTEVCAAQMADGRIMALIRPVCSPWMWETWSEDGGATWGPCVRGEFPGYATPNMLRTASGRVLVAHRLPTLAVHCSQDDGSTWDSGTIIDGSLWVMGSMLELEPDLVLYIYATETLMRGQFIRAIPMGLEPVRTAVGAYEGGRDCLAAID